MRWGTLEPEAAAAAAPLAVTLMIFRALLLEISGERESTGRFVSPTSRASLVSNSFKFFVLIDWLLLT